MATVTDNVANHRFEMIVDGETAFLDYAFANGRLALIHTEVPQALEGHGVAGALVRSVLNEARTKGLQILPRCEFVTEYIRRHPEFSDLVATLPE
jgi:predicted GNAT family acetyltransferase